MIEYTIVLCPKIDHNTGALIQDLRYKHPTYLNLIVYVLNKEHSNITKTSTEKLHSANFAMTQNLNSQLNKRLCIASRHEKTFGVGLWRFGSAECVGIVANGELGALWRDQFAAGDQ